MKIKNFKAKNVHGFLDFNIDFFDDVTFLIGINGSGKTSAIKLILGLITPSYENLSKINYEFCELTCIDNDSTITIRSDQNTDELMKFELSLSINDTVYNSNKFSIIQSEDSDDDTEELQLLKRWTSVFESDSVVKKIQSISTPKFLGLDRRIVSEGMEYRGLRSFRAKHYDEIYYKKNKFKPAGSIDVGLLQVQNLVFDYFRNIAQQQPIISAEFKDKIFKQSFDFVSNTDMPHWADESHELEVRKESVLNALENLEITNLDIHVDSYFKNMIDLSNKLKNTPSKMRNKDEYFKSLTRWFNNFHQLKRIDKIIQFSKEYQSKVEQLHTPIKKLENITTKFLSEGNKFLDIAPNGEMKVFYKNGNSADIFNLSSGEKQIIIMIAHLIFSEDLGKPGVFIIDEPELSLHITWQEIFVDSILESSPNTQFILATHSPSIISRIERESKCQDISNSYNA